MEDAGTIVVAIDAAQILKYSNFHPRIVSKDPIPNSKIEHTI